jgi:type VI secretion system secreted protein VgrG
MPADDPRVRATASFAGHRNLEIIEMHAREAISRPYEANLAVKIAQDKTVDAQELIGQPCSIVIDHYDSDRTRVIHGIIGRFAQLGEADEFSRCEMVIYPLLWLLGLDVDFRIFQNKSVPDIIEEVIGSFQQESPYSGVKFDREFVLKDEYTPREMCVQYNESSLVFLSRLMEEAGMFYFFRHSETGHKLVIADAPSAFDSAPAAFAARPGTPTSGEGIRSVKVEYTAVPAGVEVDDFDYLKPDALLNASDEDGRKERPRVRVYPSAALTPEAARRVARIRGQEQEAQRTRLAGASDCAWFRPGLKSAVTGHQAVDGAHVLVQVEHDLQGHAYRNRFVAVPAEPAFRTGQSSPAPVISGVQTATVVGPAGESVFTDEHGRIKVQFHWDKYGARNENSSCWLRVAQLWAGLERGQMFLPHVGDEVVVSFAEGDPSRPLVVGSLYNGKRKPPYALPENQNTSAIKTIAHDLTFDDSPGAEKVVLQSKKDLEIVVGGDLRISVKGVAAVVAEGELKIESKGALTTTAGTELTCGAANIKSSASANHEMTAGGTLVIKGTVVEIN